MRGDAVGWSIALLTAAVGVLSLVEPRGGHPGLQIAEVNLAPF